MQYWYQKTLILKYHKKSDNFSETLPMQSVNYLKYGLFMHIFMAYLLLSDDGLLPGEATVLKYDKNVAGE